MALLEIEGLTKSFRRGDGSALIAVNDVNISVERGDIFGFLGPNGAGKSTTIRMALGLIHPTAGRVCIGGHDLQTDRLRALRHVGAFVEAPSFYPFLSGRENLRIFASLSGGVSEQTMNDTIARVGLTGREGDKVKVYSHGMRARLGIAACLLPRPELMVLDEPTDGLDPHGIHEIRELIKKLAREEQMTVFLSSHMLREVENLCNRIAILEKGRIILQGGLSQIERDHRKHCIDVDRPAEAARLLEQNLGMTNIDVADEKLFLLLGDRAPDAVNATLVSAGFAVRQISPEDGWLDRLFLKLTTTKESTFAAAAEPTR